jgi:hypothetical protein
MIAWHARRYYYDFYNGKEPAEEPSNVFFANLLRSLAALPSRCAELAASPLIRIGLVGDLLQRFVSVATSLVAPQEKRRRPRHSPRDRASNVCPCRERSEMLDHYDDKKDPRIPQSAPSHNLRRIEIFAEVEAVPPPFGADSSLVTS